MNPVLILTRNNLELTQRAVHSVMAQDIPTHCFFFDNGSTDGTREWILESAPAHFSRDRYYSLWRENKGVSYGWNSGLKRVFAEHERCLVINNDVILSPWTYRFLLSYSLPFVSGVSVNTMEQIATIPIKPPTDLSHHPDFSCFLIRRDCWQIVGQFDTNMKHYASDLDFHIRAHRKGMRLYGANVPFYHERSSTLKNAAPEERAEIEAQANKDRAYLKQKWGCDAWSAGYDSMFDESLFGIDTEVITNG